MTRATAKLEIEFMGGDDIEAACAEAVRIAQVVGCMVVFDFNGVRCLARATTDPAALAKDWLRELQSSNKTKVAA